MRLTIAMRDSIRRTLISKRFEGMKKDLKKQEHKVALKIYNHAFGTTIRKKMEALPVGWLPTIGGMLARIPSGGTDRLYLDRELPVPFEKYQSYNLPMLLDAHDNKSGIAKLVISFFDKKAQLKKDESELSREVRVALSSFNTDKQVLDMWPEITEQVKSVCGTGTKTTALAPRLGKLNQRLGLTP